MMMKTIKEIRRINARSLRDAAGGNSSFAEQIDRDPTQTSRFMGENATKGIGDDMARHIEKCFDLPVGWLDKEHLSATNEPSVEPTYISSQFAMVPVISWVQAGAWTEISYSEKDMTSAERLPCPVPCSSMTYVLRVIGESMIEEYKQGDLIFVDPEVIPTHGDDVIALLTDTGEATFKRLVEDGNNRYLKALNASWPEQYLKINGNCTIIGTVIFSGKPRRHLRHK